MKSEYYRNFNKRTCRLCCTVQQLNPKRLEHSYKGVSKSATKQQIKKAYLEKAKLYHPDRVRTARKSDTDVKFKEISNAYSILSDPQKKREYDSIFGYDSRNSYSSWTEEDYSSNYYQRYYQRTAPPDVMHWWKEMEAEAAKLNKLYEEYLENLKKARQRERYSNEHKNKSQYWDHLHKSSQSFKSKSTRTQSQTSASDLDAFPQHFQLRKPTSNETSDVLFELVHDGKVFATIGRHKNLWEELRLSDGTLLARAVRDQDKTCETISVQDANWNQLGSVSTQYRAESNQFVLWVNDMLKQKPDPKAYFERTVTGNLGYKLTVAKSSTIYEELSFCDDVPWTLTVATLSISYDGNYTVNMLVPGRFSAALWAFMLAYDVTDRIAFQQQSDMEFKQKVDSAVSKAQETISSLYDKFSSVLKQFTSKK